MNLIRTWPSPSWRTSNDDHSDGRMKGHLQKSPQCPREPRLSIGNSGCSKARVCPEKSYYRVKGGQHILLDVMGMLCSKWLTF